MTLLWIDLETTGLDANNDHILEVAWTITHSDLTNDGRQIYSHVVETDTDGFARLKQNSFVLAMHEKTGLAAELVGDYVLPLDLIETMILRDMAEWDAKHGIEEGPWCVAGASVHFDLGFLKVHTPSLGAQLSHRVFDTSTLKAFLHDFMDIQIPNLNQHRATADVAETLEYARAARGAMQYAKDVLTDLGLADGKPVD